MFSFVLRCSVTFHTPRKNEWVQWRRASVSFVLKILNFAGSTQIQCVLNGTACINGVYLWEIVVYRVRVFLEFYVCDGEQTLPRYPPTRRAVKKLFPAEHLSNLSPRTLQRWVVLSGRD